MAKVYLDKNETFILSSPATVIGGSGTEKVLLNAGVSRVFLDVAVERAELAGNLSSYTFSITGNLVTIRQGGNVVTTITAANQTLAFADGSAALNLTGLNKATLGGANVTTTPAAVSATLDTTDKSTVSAPDTSGGTGTTINLSGAGTHDAAAANITYNVGVTSSYEVSVANFAALDALHFTAGTGVSITNTSATDGLIDIVGSLNGQSVTVHLTGIPPAMDIQVFSQASFNNAFGAGALTSV